MAALKEWLDGIVTIGSDGLPVFTRIPTVAEIAKIVPTDPEGMEVLFKMQSYLGLASPDQMRQANVQYLNRFNITPSSPLYAQRLNDLNKEVNSNATVTATARRVTQQMQTATMLDGDDRVCVYVNEGDAPCDSCLFLNGEVGKYSYFVDNNLRPGEQCLGENRCLCQLIPHGGTETFSVNPVG